MIGAFLFDDALSAREALGLAVIAAAGIGATVVAARTAPVTSAATAATATAPARR